MARNPRHWARNLELRSKRNTHRLTHTRQVALYIQVVHTRRRLWLFHIWLLPQKQVVVISLLSFHKFVNFYQAFADNFRIQKLYVRGIFPFWRCCMQIFPVVQRLKIHGWNMNSSNYLAFLHVSLVNVK